MHAQFCFLALALPSFSPVTVSQRSTHFVVEAPTAEVADRVSRAAERDLKNLSQKWLGREPTEWTEPCPIVVTIGTVGRGSSTFTFRDGRVAQQEVYLEGSLERILDGVLPHEVTHLVLTRHFCRPFPRWADEGGATLAEGEIQTTRYREQMIELLKTPERCIPLNELFGLEHYPRDSFAFYQTGSSISSFLVELKGPRTFLEFVAAGMDNDWNEAVRRCYGYPSVDDLQRAWLARLRKDKEPVRAVTVGREKLPPPAAAKEVRTEQAAASPGSSR